MSRYFGWTDIGAGLLVGNGGYEFLVICFYVGFEGGYPVVKEIDFVIVLVRDRVVLVEFPLNLGLEFDEIGINMFVELVEIVYALPDLAV